MNASVPVSISIVLDDGPMPLGLLEDRIDAWIREASAGQDTER